MALDMNRLNELTTHLTNSTEQSKAFRGMLYGGSGVGKSHLALTLMDAILPADKSFLMVDTSDNWTIADQIPGGIKHGWAHIPFTFIEDLRLFTEAIKSGIPPYNSLGGIILDEGSTMSEYDADRIFEQQVASNQTNASAPDWGTFRPAAQRYRSMLMDMFEIPNFHIIIVAHEVSPSGNSKETKTRASFSPFIYKKVKEKLGLVARVTAEESVAPGADEAVYTRMVQIHPTKAYDCKNRLGVSTIKFDTQYLPQVITNWLGTGAIEHAEATEDAPDPTDTPAAPEEASDFSAEGIEVDMSQFAV